MDKGTGSQMSHINNARDTTSDKERRESQENEYVWGYHEYLFTLRRKRTHSWRAYCIT